MGKRKDTSSAIADVLKSVFAKIESEKTFSKEDVNGFWKELAGEDGFRHSRPSDFKKKVLTVRVDNSVWLQELTIRKRYILKGLKKRFGKDKIAELHFRIGEF